MIIPVSGWWFSSHSAYDDFCHVCWNNSHLSHVHYKAGKFSILKQVMNEWTYWKYQQNRNCSLNAVQYWLNSFSGATQWATMWVLRREIKATAIVVVAKLSEQLSTAWKTLGSPVTSMMVVRGQSDYPNPRPNLSPGNKMWWMAQETTGPMSNQSNHSLVECAYLLQVIDSKTHNTISMHLVFQANLELLHVCHVISSENTDAQHAYQTMIYWCKVVLSGLERFTKEPSFKLTWSGFLEFNRLYL